MIAGRGRWTGQEQQTVQDADDSIFFYGYFWVNYPPVERKNMRIMN